MTHCDRHWMRIALLWRDTLIEEALVDSTSQVTVGAGDGNTLTVPDLAGVGARHRLFAPDPGGFVLLPTPDMVGQLTLAGGAQQSLDAVRTLRGNSIQVGGRDWGIVDLSDDLAVFFQCVSAPERVPRRPLWGTLESSMLSAVLGAVVLHLGLLVAAFLFWDPAPALATLEEVERVLSFAPEPAEPEPPEPPVTEESVAEEAGKRAAEDEGSFGLPDAVAETRVPERDAELVDRVVETGVHRALGSELLGRGPLRNVFGDKAGFSSKLDAAMAGAGDVAVAGRGSHGMGLRGTERGGGGQGFGRVRGMGRIDTGGGGQARARLDGRRDRAREVTVRRGPAEVAGFCKEADILRVVENRRRGISYCYEQALARDSTLKGTLAVSWRIMLDGKVSKVLVEQGMGHPRLEGCVKRAIGRWGFPKPEGGMCRVRFPFVFDGGL